MYRIRLPFIDLKRSDNNGPTYKALNKGLASLFRRNYHLQLLMCFLCVTLPVPFFIFYLSSCVTSQVFLVIKI